jgi:hypothetical protein
MTATSRPLHRLALLLALGVVFLAPRPGEAAPPGAAAALGPGGLVAGPTLTFTWQAGAAATFYYLQVNDATSAPRYTAWYPAGQACADGSATCFISLSLAFAAGPGIWWVQTWNPDGFGPWSAGMPFTVGFVPGAWSQKLPSAGRFQIVLDGLAVLDRETGLVWERTPSQVLGAPWPDASWPDAIEACLAKVVANRKGWRLATLEELFSLVDETQSNPALPPGHPFGSLSSSWSATSRPADTSWAYFLNFGTGNAGSTVKTTATRFLCVRGQVPQTPH